MTQFGSFPFVFLKPCPTSSIQHPTSNIQHPTSNIQHPTSNIQHLVLSFSFLPSSPSFETSCAVATECHYCLATHTSPAYHTRLFLTCPRLHESTQLSAISDQHSPHFTSSHYIRHATQLSTRCHLYADFYTSKLEPLSGHYLVMSLDSSSASMSLDATTETVVTFPPSELADFVLHYDNTAFHVHNFLLHHHSAYFRTYF